MVDIAALVRFWTILNPGSPMSITQIEEKHYSFVYENGQALFSESTVKVCISLMKLFVKFCCECHLSTQECNALRKRKHGAIEDPRSYTSSESPQEIKKLLSDFLKIYCSKDIFNIFALPVSATSTEQLWYGYPIILFIHH